MAARKTGLGKGLDGLFPSYTDKPGKNADSRSEKKNSASDVVRKKNGSGKDKRSAETPAKGSASSDTAIKDGVISVKISSVNPNREQPRKAFDEDALQELAESIRNHGVIQPLLVQKKKGVYEIIAGERRWRAAKLAGLKEIPVIVREYSTQEAVEISLIENIQRQDLNPIEEAGAYQRLLNEFQLKQDEVAERVAKNRTTITNALRLLKLDERVQEMLVDEKISAGHARALLQIEDKEQQYEMAQRVFDEQLSVREVERIMRKMRDAKDKKPAQNKPSGPSALDLICQDMEDHMKEVLGTKVNVHRTSDKKGKIEIEYYSNEELERIYELIRTIRRE